MMKQRLLFLIILGGLSALNISAQDAKNDEKPHNLDEAVVTGTRTATDPRYLSETVSVVDRQTLTQDYRSSVLPTLNEQVPGLFINSRGVMGYGVSTGAAGTMKIRGIGGMAQMLILVDGLPQYAGLMGHPIADAYQTMLAEKVEVVRGPASLFYGSNAMGGVLNIISRKMAADGVRSEAQLSAGSYGSLISEFTNQTRFGRFSSSAGINYQRTDGDRANSQFEQASGFAKLGYDFSDIWKAQAGVNLTWFQASNPGEISNPYIDNDSRILRGLASAAVTNRYEHTNGAISAYYSWGHHHINDGYHEGGTPQATRYIHDDLQAGVSAYQSVSLFTGNRITLGVDYQLFGGEAYNRVVATGEKRNLRNSPRDTTENDIAGYLSVNQDLASWVTVDAGIRLDHHSRTGTEWVPQGGLVFRLPKDAQIKATIGKGFRNPTIRELYMFPPHNPDLKPERLMNYELAFNQTLLDGRLHYGANVFYLKADNLINTIYSSGKPQNVNTGAVENWGIEAEGRYRVSEAFSLNGNYSFLHMNHPIVGAPEHKAFLGANYQKNRFQADGGLQWVTGLYLTTAPEHRENFVLLNATVSYAILPEIRVFAHGENLLAQSYQMMAGYPMPRATFMAGFKVSF